MRVRVYSDFMADFSIASEKKAIRDSLLQQFHIACHCKFNYISFLHCDGGAAVLVVLASPIGRAAAAVRS